MGLLGTLLGRKKQPPVPWAQALDAMAQASPVLQDDLETVTTGQAALLIQPAKESAGGNTAAEVESALARTMWLSVAGVRVQTDAEQHAWVVGEAGSLGELVSLLQRVSTALQAEGLEQRILAAVFPFAWKQRRLYWLCRSRTGRYSPFAAVEESPQPLRDYPLELRMEAALRKYLPTERDLSQWYPLWDIPLG